MVPIPSSESLVYDLKLSSVVPASITGENKNHELTNMDLIMKLHYIKGIYFFKSDAAQGLSISELKRSMFQCLVLFYPLSGRMRTSESGRPYIKCNDSGVRIVEAKCSKTVDQWLELSDSSLYNDQLTYNQFLGPDFGFTPLVFVQFTWFKCGGLSIGLSWAHALGDAFSASQFINIWGQILAGQGMPASMRTNNHTNKVNNYVSSVFKVPSSLQRILLEAAGDQWLISNHLKMQSHSIHITAQQLNHLTQASKLVKKPFEVISAMIWKCLAKVRGKSSEPKNVTICTRKHTHSLEENNTPQVSISNSQVTVWTVEAASLKAAISEADLTELSNLLAQEKVDETSRVEEVMDHEKDVNDGKFHDFILYGANLTFVNLEGVELYGLELKGHKPVFANCNLRGVGDEGAILVLPAGPDDDIDGGGKDKEERGRMVNLILPENQLEGLKKELQIEWHIFSH